MSTKGKEIELMSGKVVDVPYRCNERDMTYTYELVEFNEYSTFFHTPEDELMGLDFLLAEPNRNEGLFDPFLGMSATNSQNCHVREDKYAHKNINDGRTESDISHRREQRHLELEDFNEQTKGIGDGVVQEMNNLPSLCEEYLFDTKLVGEESMLDCASSSGCRIDQPCEPVSNSVRDCSRLLGSCTEDIVVVESPSHPNLNQFDQMTIKELHEAFKNMFGKETLVADRLWLKWQIVFGAQNLNESSNGSNFSENIIDWRGNYCETAAESVNKPMIRRQSITDGSVRGCRSPAKVSNKKTVTDVRSQVKNPLLYHSVDARSSTIDGIKSHSRDQDEGFTQKRLRKRPIRYMDEYSNYQSVYSNKRSEGPSKSSRKMITRSRSQLQDRTKNLSKGELITNDDFMREAIQVPFLGQIKDHDAANSNKGILRISDKSAHTELKLADGQDDKPNDDVLEELSKNKSARKHARVQKKNANSSLILAVVQDDKSNDDFLDGISDEKSAKRHNRYWSEYEVARIIEGVTRFGVGKWRDIQNSFFPPSSGRTAVNLKDKWRNLVKASSTQFYCNKEGRRGGQQQAVSPSILRQVKDLAMSNPCTRTPGPKNALVVRC